MPASVRTWSTDTPCEVEGDSLGDLVSKIWFRTGPLDNTFIYRAAQLQLSTDSHDQGWVDNKDAGAWSWFELVILPDEKSTEPVVRDGKELVWRSHSNRLGSNQPTRHFGLVFDRRQEILDTLEVSDPDFKQVNITWAYQYCSPVMSSEFASVRSTQAGSIRLFAVV
jgi:hypothetical protein